MTKDGPDGGRLSGQGAAASEQLTTTHPTRSDTTAAHGAQKMTATDSGDVTATAATQQPSPMAKRFAAQLEPGVHVSGGNAADRPRRGLAGGALASALDADEAGLLTKLRKAAETFTAVPPLYKRRRTDEPAGRASALDLILFTMQDDESPPHVVVPGWPSDQTYNAYLASKGLNPATAKQMLSAPAAGPRTWRDMPAGLPPGGSTPSATMRVPLSRPVRSPPPRVGAATPQQAPGTASKQATLVAGASGGGGSDSGGGGTSGGMPVVRQSVHKQALMGTKKATTAAGTRTYTSRYRGVHQTFPTRRWEAQFRRAGKPTSLGCFDKEEEAARAYDKMMLWCDLHNADMRTLGLLRSAPLTNFPAEEYDEDLEALREMTQDELVLELRKVGRMQAAASVTPRGGVLPPRQFSLPPRVLTPGGGNPAA